MRKHDLRTVEEEAFKSKSGKSTTMSVQVVQVLHSKLSKSIEVSVKVSEVKVLMHSMLYLVEVELISTSLKTV